MKNISLITLNIPGLEAAIATAYDLTRVNKNFRLNIYYKQGNINDSFNFLRFENIDEVIEKVWKSSDAIIWFVSTGIIIRKIAPLLNSKVIDPANIVINLDRTQIIPLLSNHIGGANKLVTDLCSVNKALAPFITTATDSLDIFAFDNFAKAHGYEILNIKELAKISNSWLISGR
ncbi:MAG: hypothetical protein MZU97_01665 [Bacillus subtilis]|nr:hypothetical protein [Bacillus subtilis]